MNRQEASAFYRMHSKPLYNAALRILHDCAEAEEVMQDTLLKYIRQDIRSATPAQAAAWLRTSCIRAAIDRLRARKHDPLWQAVREEDPPLRSDRGEASGEMAEDPVLDDSDTWEGPMPDVMQIRREMETMPPPYGLVLNLVLIEGLDYSEIARLTGQKESTLRSIYARGRARLAERLKKMKI
ncbi:MAG: RNA polymerase sigma factor [Bacteroidales bacterium]|nr:RNA polymerase sigma factor [Bacteroidales bacterium]